MLIRMLLTTLTLTGCDGESEWEKQERLAWSAPCKDEATLLATTAGSPSVKKCPNRLHVMQVQVATQASNEEAAALVFCRCERGDAGK